MWVLAKKYVRKQKRERIKRIANVKIIKVKYLTKLKGKSKKWEVSVPWLNPSLTQILCNKRPTAWEEKMHKAHEHTIRINTVGQYACGEGSSSPVFKNVKSNFKGQINAQNLKGIICNFGKGVLKWAFLPCCYRYKLVLTSIKWRGNVY